MFPTKQNKFHANEGHGQTDFLLSLEAQHSKLKPLFYNLTSYIDMLSVNCQWDNRQSQTGTNLKNKKKHNTLNAIYEANKKIK